MKRALVALLLVASCSRRQLDVPETTPTTTSSSQPQTYDAFIDDYAQVICARYVTCGLMDVAQMTACLAYTRSAALPVPPYPADGLASGVYVYDPAGAAACIDAAAAATCVLPSTPCGEFDVLHATVTPGGACTTNEVCTTRSCHCDGSGVCGALASIGDFCAAGCSEGAICSSAGLCVAVPVAGEACVGGMCGDGLACVLDSNGNPRCEAPGELGAPCSPAGADFEGLAGCDTGFACDFTLGKPSCVPLATAGHACGSPSGCVLGLRCAGLDVKFSSGAKPVVEPGATPGVCSPPFSPGSTCSASADDCPAFTTCLGGFCTPTPLLGDTCAPYPDCIGAFCDPGTLTCVASIAEGQPRDASNEHGATSQCQQDGSGFASPGLFCDGFSGLCGSNAPACE